MSAFAVDGTGRCRLVVEPVGAGDAFAAGYLYGLLLGFTETAVLRLGQPVAATALRGDR
ncbi:PfkB family carbohydrate kinase [Streptomyces sp. NPDC048527]|uniref:PfkB family carbohydrate kinase n=1 Tax=Streptomyces sp. NPDC048527 TaxID=3365568 RepID=UPI00371E95A7